MQSPELVHRHAKFRIGQVVKHRVYPFRGVIFDVDPTFNNTEEWWQSIPDEMRPRKDQPFYHLLAENGRRAYVAYVSEQNLLPDESRRAGAPSAGRSSSLDGYAAAATSRARALPTSGRGAGRYLRCSASRISVSSTSCREGSAGGGSRAPPSSGCSSA